MDLYNIRRLLKPYSMAIVSVFISVLSITVVSLISSAGKKEISKELDGIGLNGMSISAYNSYKENITDRNLYNILKDNENITTLTPVLYDFAQVKFSTGEIQDCMCWGISNTAEYIVNLDRIHGRMITEKDVKNRNMICLIDEAIADRIYGRLNITGKTIYITTSGGVYPLEIVGIVNKSSDLLNGMSGEIIPDFIYIPFSTMEDIYRKENLDQILFNVKDTTIREEDIEKYVSAKAEMPAAVNLKITNLSKQRRTIDNIVNAAFFALFAVSCVAVVVCSISVGTSVNTAVINAKHDIGIKISLGARKSDIAAEFLGYSFIACIIGVTAGILCGIGVLAVTNITLDKNYGLDLPLILRGISATIFLAVIFSIYPSMKAAGMTPVKALNRE
ncbi:MAG: ABC transporter permease [Oscillospiraceae bacterium]|nr:ABC transporter permease [Oscillospiraceae bacterium]